MRTFKVAALTSLLLCGLPFGARAGTITRVTASPSVVVTGQTVTFTEEGTNPCGASNMTYGDGIVITYAITELPAKQTHVFEKPGTYTVIARGMGNCDGEATTRVQVNPAAVPPPAAAPPAAPPQGPHVTSVEFAPAQSVIRRPVTFIVNGQGTCRFIARFGDGNSRELNVELPYRFDHTYAVPGTYTTIIAPTPPCSGKFTQLLTVAARAVAPRVFDVAIEPSITRTGQPVTITIQGSGTCNYAIDFGDGNNDSRNAPLPDRLQHNYPAPDEYIVNVTAIPPCTGSGRRRLEVRER
jgi:PKD repeat protein